MKVITSFCSVVALILATSALAQQFASPPSSSPKERFAPAVETTPEIPPEKASADIVETPTKSSSTPEKKEEPVKATEKKESTAAASVSKKSTPAAETKPGRKMSVEATLKEMENKWEACVPTHDVATLQSLVAPDFTGVTPKGKFTNRSALLAELKNDKDTYKSAKNEKLNVHIYAPNVAVVTGIAREKGTDKEGKDFERTYRFTDTWVERNGQWQCVASQDTLVASK